MLIDEEAVSRTIEVLKPVDFYKENHRKIYEAMLGLQEENQPVDLVTLSEKLRAENLIDEVGGVEYLTEIANSVPTAANVEYYAKIVEEKSVLRQLINAATRIARMGYEEPYEVDKLLDEAEKVIFEISQHSNERGFIPIKEVIMETFDRIENLYNKQDNVTGVPCGFKDLDNYLSGLQPADLIILAARPAMGKTTLALNMAHYISARGKNPAAIFSLEMSKDQLVQRMLCAEAEIDAHKLRTGNLNSEDWPKLGQAVGPLSQAPLYIDDTPAMSVMEMRTKARKLKAEKGLEAIFIDYLQLMQSNQNQENRQQEISQISRSLKALAKELNVPVIALSQLSRAVEQRQEKKPMLSDLLESGGIEANADVVLFIYRDEYYNPDSQKESIAEIIVAKQRNGPVGSMELYFKREFNKFVNLEKRYVD